MRHVAAVLALGAAGSLAGCSGPAPSTPVPSTVTEVVTATPTPTAGSSTPSASATPTTQTFPAGYPYLILKRITRESGTWSLVADPVTLCTQESTEPACEPTKADMVNDYAIVNQSTRLYTVPFAPGATVRLLRSGEPNDYATSAPTVRSFPDDEVIATVRTDDQGRILEVTQWWHP